MNPATLSALEPRLYPAQSVHQKNVERYFRKSLRRALSEEEQRLLKSLDLYFVVFTNRSGSTYLTEILHQMGAGVHPRAEYFNDEMVVQASRREGFPTFIDYLLQVVSDNHQNGKIGFKISINQLFWATREGLLESFRSVKLIESVRTDVLGQAISHYKARATGKWHSLMPGHSDAPVEYEREEILKSLLTISSRRGLFDYYCAIHGLPRLDVVYESLLADPLGEMVRLGNFLQLPAFAPEAVDLNAIGISQQRNEENERLRRAFIDEFHMSSEIDSPRSGTRLPVS